MKYIGYAFRLLLPVAAIVLLVLSMRDEGPNQQLLLTGGLLCSCTGMWVNIYCQRKQKKQTEEKN